MGVYAENYQEYVGWSTSNLSGDDTLTNYANHVDIYPGNGNDSIKNWGEIVLIDCNEGDDVVINFASNVTIDGGNGNDEIYTHTDINNITINGGFSGDDTIHCFSHNSTLNGGVNGSCLFKNYGNDNAIIGARGNDYILNWTSGNTAVWGGSGSEGNDTLIGGGGQDIFWFGKDDGHDTFLNAGNEDLILLYDIDVSRFAYSNSYSDNTVEVKFRGGSSIKVQSNSEFSPVFQFSSGERYAFNHSGGYWQYA